jgi:hypothetical protein
MIRPLLRRCCPARTQRLDFGTQTLGYFPYQPTGDGLCPSCRRTSFHVHVVVRCKAVLSTMLLHAGTAEPLQVSPPEAVAYLFKLFRTVCFCSNAPARCPFHTFTASPWRSWAKAQPTVSSVGRASAQQGTGEGLTKWTSSPICLREGRHGIFSNNLP